MMGAHVQQSESSSQRKLGSILILLFAQPIKVKTDPSLRWDDDLIFNHLGFNRHRSVNA